MRAKDLLLLAGLLQILSGHGPAAETTALYESDFQSARYGTIPALQRLVDLYNLNLALPDAAAGATVSAAQLGTALNAISPAWSQQFAATRFADEKQITAGEFALLAARLLILQPNRH